VASIPEVLDAEMLADLSALMGGEGSEEFQELVDTFIAYAADKIVGMRDAVAEGDADGLRQAAHALKSSSGSMAARSLMELCAATERAASSGDLRAAGENVPAIEAEFAQVQAALAGQRTAKAADAP
jgi:HPt (histidine-containing phosphotransfer) domain-containing protein